MEDSLLELRPICEHCARPLPPDSTEARICSFECTFCSTCTEEMLGGVCPNCGGNLVPRPIRPRKDWTGHGATLDAHPSAAKVKHRPADLEKHGRLRAQLEAVPPHQR